MLVAIILQGVGVARRIDLVIVPAVENGAEDDGAVEGVGVERDLLRHVS